MKKEYGARLWLRLKRNQKFLLKKEEKNKKTEKKASGGRIGFDKGGISDAQGYRYNCTSLVDTECLRQEQAYRNLEEEFPDKRRRIIEEKKR